MKKLLFTLFTVSFCLNSLSQVIAADISLIASIDNSAVVSEIDSFSFKKTLTSSGSGDVSIKAIDTPLDVLLSELSKQFGYSLLFKENVNTLKKISLDIREVSVKKALSLIATASDYVIMIQESNKSIIVANSGSQTYKLSGYSLFKLSKELNYNNDNSIHANIVLKLKELSKGEVIVSSTNPELITVTASKKGLDASHNFLKSILDSENFYLDFEISVLELNKLTIQDLNLENKLDSSNLNVKVKETLINLGLSLKKSKDDSAIYTTDLNSLAIIQAIEKLGGVSVVVPPKRISLNDISLYSIFSVENLATAFPVSNLTFNLSSVVIDANNLQLILKNNDSKNSLNFMVESNKTVVLKDVSNLFTITDRPKLNTVSLVILKPTIVNVDTSNFLINEYL